jgi:hypothetical protein
VFSKCDQVCSTCVCFAAYWSSREGGSNLPTTITLWTTRNFNIWFSLLAPRAVRADPCNAAQRANHSPLCVGAFNVGTGGGGFACSSVQVTQVQDSVRPSGLITTRQVRVGAVPRALSVLHRCCRRRACGCKRARGICNRSKVNSKRGLASSLTRRSYLARVAGSGCPAR